MGDADVRDLKEIRKRSIDLVATDNTGVCGTRIGAGADQMGEMRDGVFTALLVALGKRFIVYQVVYAMNGAAIAADNLAIYAGDGTTPERSLRMKVKAGKSDVQNQAVLTADPRVGLFSIEPKTADQDDEIRVATEAADMNVAMRGYFDD